MWYIFFCDNVTFIPIIAHRCWFVYIVVRVNCHGLVNFWSAPENLLKTIVTHDCTRATAPWSAGRRLKFWDLIPHRHVIPLSVHTVHSRKGFTQTGVMIQMRKQFSNALIMHTASCWISCLEMTIVNNVITMIKITTVSPPCLTFQLLCGRTVNPLPSI